ncbi:hypothetical protein evm_006153 [Chilo suppressalis]|nr:hypothetical protein evm_006153 [Chilo suppressalis]
MHSLLLRNVVLVFIAVLYANDCKELETPQRRVNLALETVLQFDNNENSADIEIIDKVQDFLKRVKRIIRNNRDSRRTAVIDDNTPLTFTDFVKSALVILSSYNDEDLEEVAAVVDEELRKYHYKGCKFYELIENGDVRRFMADKLDKIRNVPGKELKRQLTTTIKKLTDSKDGFKHMLISTYLNSLYSEKDSEKFNDFLKHIAVYKQKSKRSNLDLVKIIRKGLRSIVFDHYSKLDSNTRRGLKIKLETFWEDVNNVKYGDVWRFETQTRPNNQPQLTIKTTNIYNEHLKSFIKPIPKKVDKQKVKRNRKEKPDKKEFVNSDDFETLIRQTNKKVNKKKVKKLKIEKPHTKEFTVKEIHKEVTKKKAKRLRTIKPLTGIVDADRERNVREPKFTFITLYPEAISVSRPHQRNHKKSKKTLEKYKRVPHRSTADYKHVTALRTDRKLKPNKRIFWNSNYTINVESLNLKKDIIDHRAVKRMRFETIKKSPVMKSTTKSYNKRKHAHRSRKIDPIIKAIDESDEGLNIEAFDSRKERNRSYKRKPVRKSNDNDTLTAMTMNPTTIVSNANDNNTDFIRKLKELEIELKEVKEHIEKSIKTTTTPLDTTRYDILDFWEGTTTLPNIEDETTRTTTPKTTTTSSTTTAKSTTTKAKTTTDKKLLTTVKVSHKKPTHARKRTTTTQTTANTEPKPVFRSDDKDKDAKDKDTELNEVIPKSPTTVRTTRFIDRVELKLRSSNSSNSTTTRQSPTTELNILNITANKPVDTTPSSKKFDDKRELSPDLEVETYLNDTKMLDDEMKSQMVKQKMMDDLNKLIPESTVETLGTTTESLSVAKIVTTDELAVMDDGDDILK